ncbi:MAG TPA: hypothetical protein DF409_16540 [Bacteroidales bacterium]|nr:hypothetical protein [Bacteroidales bacterium]
MITPQALDEIITNQTETGYNFKPGFLSDEEIYKIKQDAGKERYDIQKAPLGRRVFSYIQSKHPEIHFEKEHFESDFDAMIYFPNHDNSVVFIILNQNKPLVNQIFACAHEYYHYLYDVADIANNPLICYLDRPESISREHKASRFAAEYLLPRDALIEFVDTFMIRNKSTLSELPDEISLVPLIISLTLHFEMPIKAILYRLQGKKYYSNNLKNVEPLYALIKNTIDLLNKRYPERFSELFEKNNLYLDDSIYNVAANVYNQGLVTYDRLTGDMEYLGISMDTLGLQPPKFDPGEEDDS